MLHGVQRGRPTRRAMLDAGVEGTAGLTERGVRPLGHAMGPPGVRWKSVPLSSIRAWSTEIPSLARPFRGLGDGAQGRNRTTDTAIFSRMLYQLSYLGPRLR